MSWFSSTTDVRFVFDWMTVAVIAVGVALGHILGQVLTRVLAREKDTEPGA